MTKVCIYHLHLPITNTYNYIYDNSFSKPIYKNELEYRGLLTLLFYSEFLPSIVSMVANTVGQFSLTFEIGHDPSSSENIPIRHVLLSLRVMNNVSRSHQVLKESSYQA